MKKLKWYWWVLIIAVVIFILYKLATKHNSTVQFTQNADGTSTSYVTTPTHQMIITHDQNGDTQSARTIRLVNMR